MSSVDESDPSPLQLYYLIDDELHNNPLLSSLSTETQEDLPSTESSLSSVESSPASMECELDDDSRTWQPIDSLDTTFLQPVLDNIAGEMSVSDDRVTKATDYIDGFIEEHHLKRDVARRLRADFSDDDLQSLLSFQSDELWIRNCQYGYEFQKYVLSMSQLCMSKSDRQSETSKPSSCKKVCIHTFCLDLLNNEKYEDVVQWIDKNILVFKVIDPSAVAKLWKRVKANRKVDYETFGRGIRFSMKRGYFTKVRPQKKKVYRLTEKSLRSYRDYLKRNKSRQT